MNILNDLGTDVKVSRVRALKSIGAIFGAGAAALVFAKESKAAYIPVTCCRTSGGCAGRAGDPVEWQYECTACGQSWNAGCMRDRGACFGYAQQNC